MAELLCANDKVFCAQEFLGIQEDHSKIRVPAGFHQYAQKIGRSGKTPLRVKNSMAVLDNKKAGAVLAYGNKFPLYSHVYDRVMSELNTPKAIMLFRNPRRCAMSYQRRSLDQNDNWPAGRNAIFAAIEMLHIFKILSRTKYQDTLVVPQTYLAENRKDVLKETSEYLLPGVDYSIDENIIKENEHRQAAHEGLPSIPFSKVASELLDILDAKGVNDIFPDDRTVQLSSVQNKIREFSQNFPEDYVQFLEAYVRKVDNPLVQEHFLRWKCTAGLEASP